MSITRTPSPEIDTADDTLRAYIRQYIPDGFRDDDGVWHEGPHRDKAEACLGVLIAAREQAELDADDARQLAHRLGEIVADYDDSRPANSQEHPH